MRIQKITEEELDFVCAICLDPSIDKKSRTKMQSWMDDRICWIKKMMQKGLEILVALEQPRPERIKYKWAGEMLHSNLAVHGQVPKGLLESLPIEFALEPVKGKNLLFIDCVWILPPFWSTGVAKGLIESFIQRAKQFGGACVLAYDGDKWFGTSIKYMPSSFFERFGFKEVDRNGSRVFLFLDLGANNQPKLIYPKNKSSPETNKITIDALYNNQCPWSGYMIDEIKNNLKKYTELTVNVVNMDDRKKILEFGLSRGVYINGKPVIKRMSSWEEIKVEVDKHLKNMDKKGRF